MISMNRWIGILSFAFLLSSLVPAQAPVLSVPNGLPAWAFNIPDKVQPPSAPASGPVHASPAIRRFARELVSEALSEKLVVKVAGSKPWMKSFGGLKALRQETKRIGQIIDQEFDQVESEDLQ